MISTVHCQYAVLDNQRYPSLVGKCPGQALAPRPCDLLALGLGFGWAWYSVLNTVAQALAGFGFGILVTGLDLGFALMRHCRDIFSHGVKGLFRRKGVLSLQLRVFTFSILIPSIQFILFNLSKNQRNYSLIQYLFPISSTSSLFLFQHGLKSPCPPLTRLSITPVWKIGHWLCGLSSTLSRLKYSAINYRIGKTRRVQAIRATWHRTPAETQRVQTASVVVNASRPIKVNKRKELPLCNMELAIMEAIMKNYYHYFLGDWLCASMKPALDQNSLVCGVARLVLHNIIVLLFFQLPSRWHLRLVLVSAWRFAFKLCMTKGWKRVALSSLWLLEATTNAC
ncbi:uncharacterized protein LOC130775426 [Actinidia eriantha]|uniref:uncharacterized protein LOC130775426 n=1 Tax=Actinidia eriantha TaxID=165200 RepID=UPI002585F728|nr:uncharacterized protein LOC130775426 [Actinidia eriantha]